METYFLNSEDIPKFYGAIAKKYDLYVPVKIDSSVAPACLYSFRLPTADYLLKNYALLGKLDEVVFNDYRCVEPTRAFFTHFKEEVCGNLADKADKEQDNVRPVAICGVKNCDIFSLRIQDYVFLNAGEEDQLYARRRKNTLIISGDCSSFKEACFCQAFDIPAYPAQGFDLNLSPLTHGYLLDVDSDKAKAIVKTFKEILTPATFGQLSGRSAKRESVRMRLDEHLSHHKIPKKETLQDIVLSGYASAVWQEQMRTCVECGGCVFMCDTCHCFLLSEEQDKGLNKKMRTWDGCLFKNFTRVAGGANPLKMRYMRLRNRYLKKFDFFISNLGFQACCGCGRCIEVCPGKIDIRYILRRLYEEKYLPAH